MEKTGLHDWHQAQGAMMAPFAGWHMPIHYGSQIQEHHQVRQKAGMFDVSHMFVVDCQGPEAKQALQMLLANNVEKISVGQAQYTCLLNEAGGIIDDLIVYYLKENHYRIISNAATKDKDWTWIQEKTNSFKITWSIMTDYLLIAVQGPNARDIAARVLPSTIQDALMALKPFHFFNQGAHFIARTGYTGEDGFECLLPTNIGVQFWQNLYKSGVAPIGLAARDTLRLESGLNLYGQDMDETVTPLESNIAWTVALEPNDRHFIGRQAIEKQKKEPHNQLVGLVLRDKVVLRSHQSFVTDTGLEGIITSGSYSPSLECSIAMARVPAHAGYTALLNIRKKEYTADIVPLPFWKKGKSQLPSSNQEFSYVPDPK